MWRPTLWVQRSTTCAGVAPGLDFESHYGIGHAYVFSYLIGDGGLQQTLETYVLFVLTVVILYFLSAFLVLTDWLQNPWAALWVTLAIVLSCCEGMSYNYPSNWPVRHPFLFTFLFAAVRGVDHRWWCVAAGSVAGISLFWQTDIGLYTLAAGVLFYAANWVFLGGSAWRPFVFLAGGVGSFFAICTTLFGPRVLSFTFAERLLEPLLLYANGFGTTLMNWNRGWSYWYNLAGPAIAIASVGVMIGYGRRKETPPRGVLYAALASLLGLAMLFKWVNRSIDILWGLNGVLVVASAWWWILVGWAHWPRGFRMEHSRGLHLAQKQPQQQVSLHWRTWQSASIRGPRLPSTSAEIRLGSCACAVGYRTTATQSTPREEVSSQTRTSFRSMTTRHNTSEIIPRTRTASQ